MANSGLEKEKHMLMSVLVFGGDFCWKKMLRPVFKKTPKKTWKCFKVVKCRPSETNSDTPWKINMEPTNHPFRKENDLPNLHDYGQ